MQLQSVLKYKQNNFLTQNNMFSSDSKKLTMQDKGPVKAVKMLQQDDLAAKSMLTHQM